MKELSILKEIIILEWDFIRERRLWIQKVDGIATETFRNVTTNEESVTRSLDSDQ